MIKDYLNELLSEGKVGDLLTPYTDKEIKDRDDKENEYIEELITRSKKEHPEWWNELKDIKFRDGLKPVHLRLYKYELAVNIYDTYIKRNHNVSYVPAFADKLSGKILQKLENMYNISSLRESVGDLLVPMSKEEQDKLDIEENKKVESVYKTERINHKEWWDNAIERYPDRLYTKDSKGQLWR
jgi:hypothetical protein